MAPSDEFNWFDHERRLNEAVRQKDTARVKAILDEAVAAGVKNFVEFAESKHEACKEALKTKQMELVEMLFPIDMMYQLYKLKDEPTIDIVNVAIDADCVDGIRYLQSKGLALELPASNWSALEEAVKYNRLEVLQFLLLMYDLNLNPNPDQTLLMVACERQNFDVINILLHTQVRFTINQRSKREKYTALHWCVQTFNHNLDFDVVRMLVEAGADSNIMASRDSPVLLAARRGLLSVVTYLLSTGTDMDIKGNIKHVNVIFHVAVNSVGEPAEYVSFVRAIIEAGLDVNHKLEDTQTPVNIAISVNNRNLLMALIYFKFDIDTQTPLLTSLRLGHKTVPKMLILAGCDVHARDLFGVTALLEAVARSKITVVKYLLYKGADVHVLDPEDNCPCDFLFLYSHDCEINGEILKVLLEAGGDLGKYEHILAYVTRTQKNVNATKMLHDVYVKIGLKSRCRLVIRNCIGEGLSSKVTQLGLPNSLQDFVLLKDWKPEESSVDGINPVTGLLKR